jgi:hypothetical protein
VLRLNASRLEQAAFLDKDTKLGAFNVTILEESSTRRDDTTYLFEYSTADLKSATQHVQEMEKGDIISLAAV